MREMQKANTANGHPLCAIIGGLEFAGVLPGIIVVARAHGRVVWHSVLVSAKTYHHRAVYRAKRRRRKLLRRMIIFAISPRSRTLTPCYHYFFDTNAEAANISQLAWSLSSTLADECRIAPRISSSRLISSISSATYAHRGEYCRALQFLRARRRGGGGSDQGLQDCRRLHLPPASISSHGICGEAYD